MNKIQLGPKPEEFVWATGIEDSFVPQTRPGHRALDEYALMGHYEHWREDLELVKRLGMSAVRWGVPWYRVEPLPGEFDWRWTDQVVPYIVEELGVTPIIDLMHYGCPYWLRQEFMNEDYPAAVARYAAAFAARYRDLVDWYTPCNEPLMTAELCGRKGAWPPYLRGDRGYIKIMMQASKGIVRTVDALKQVNPDARMVHVDAAGICRTSEPGLEGLAHDTNLRNYLVYDLVSGRVTEEHPLYPWLTLNGARTSDLQALVRQPIAIDVLGLNFYPQWSTAEIYTNANGRVGWRTTDHDGAGFGEMVEGFYHRYGVPILITETSARDSDLERSNWLKNSLRMVKELRGRGVPVMGYTWFPLFTMVDWRYRWQTKPIEKYYLDLGAYTLNKGDGDRWLTTPIVSEMQEFVRNPEEAIGHLSVG